MKKAKRKIVKKLKYKLVKHSSRLMKDIELFHKKFRRKPAKKPSFLEIQEFEFRLKFIQEEIDELVKAYAEKDLADYADAWVDIVYVALGGAHLSGLPFDRLWAEVQKANMKKKRASSAGDSARGYACDIVKPKSWKPPQITRVLEAHGGIVVKTYSAKELLAETEDKIVNLTKPKGDYHEEIIKDTAAL